jgi:hypothetical protein
VAKAAAAKTLAAWATPAFEIKDAVELTTSPQAREEAYSTLKDVTENGSQFEKISSFGMAPTKNLYALGRLLKEGADEGQSSIVQQVNAMNSQLTTNQKVDDQKVRNALDVPPIDAFRPRGGELELKAAQKAFEPDHRAVAMQLIGAYFGRSK